MVASNQIILVIGASRGIGKELVNQFAASDDGSNTVIGTVRKPTQDFDSLSNVSTLILDQNDPESVAKAAAQVKELDILMVNGAIGADEYLLSTSEKRFEEYLLTNVLGVHRVITAFLPALRARKTRKIVITSSQSGSLEKQVNANRGFMGPYAVTKAANNMYAVQLHNELHEKEGFTIVPIHPGWVATDMGNSVGGGKGAIPIPDSAKGIVKVAREVKFEESATFFVYNGSTLPW